MTETELALWQWTGWVAITIISRLGGWQTSDYFMGVSSGQSMSLRSADLVVGVVRLTWSCMRLHVGLQSRLASSLFTTAAFSQLLDSHLTNLQEEVPDDSFSSTLCLCVNVVVLTGGTSPSRSCEVAVVPLLCGDICAVGEWVVIDVLKAFLRSVCLQAASSPGIDETLTKKVQAIAFLQPTYSPVVFHPVFYRQELTLSSRLLFTCSIH